MKSTQTRFHESAVTLWPVEGKTHWWNKRQGIFLTLGLPFSTEP